MDMVMEDKDGPTTIEGLYFKLLTNVDIGSKRFLTNKVDRSVTGLIAQQQQCVGPLHTPLSDYALISSSLMSNDKGIFSGVASAIGEQPYYGFVDVYSMVEKTLGEMLLNLVWVVISNF